MGVQLSISVPRQWTAIVAGANQRSKTFSEPVAPGASVSATFRVTSGPAAFNGELFANARWMTGGRAQTERTAEKVRNVSPVKINEFRINDGSPTNTTNAFVELFNA